MKLFEQICHEMTRTYEHLGIFFSLIFGCVIFLPAVCLVIAVLPKKIFKIRSIYVRLRILKRFIWLHELDIGRKIIRARDLRHPQTSIIQRVATTWSLF